MRHLPIRELGYAVAFLVVVAALYSGTYFAMVKRYGYVIGRGPAVETFTDGVDYALVGYRFGGQTAESFFAPMHAIDRLLRPRVWINEPE